MDRIAIDASGSIWLPGETSVGKLLNSGANASGSPFNAGGIASPVGIAIDGSGNAWIANSCTCVTCLQIYTISELAPSGVAISGAGGYGSGVNGLVYIASQQQSFILPIDGILSSPRDIAVDGSGNVWLSTSNNDSVIEVIGAAAPVVTPLAIGVKNNTLGTRP